MEHSGNFELKFKSALETIKRQKLKKGEQIETIDALIPVLTTPEQHELYDFVITSMMMHVPVSDIQFKIKAAEIRNRRKEDNSTEQFINGLPDSNWIEEFMRFNKLSYRTPNRIKKERLLVTKQQVKKFYEETNLYFNNMNDILEKSANVYNFDETTIYFEIEAEKDQVIAPIETKIVYDKRKNAEKLCASIGYIMRASGSLLPPQILFSKAPENKAEFEKFCIEHNFILGVSGNAVQTKKTFQEYFKHLVQILEKPALVFLDGNSAHCDQVFVGWCREKDVFLKFLPPNSTHILQPADVVLFRSVKNAYRKKFTEWRSKNENKKLTAFDFVQLLSEVNTCIEGTLIQKSFEKAGIWPFDINKNIDRFIDDHGEQTIQKVNTRRFSQIEENEETASCSTHQNKIVKITESGKFVIQN